MFPNISKIIGSASSYFYLPIDDVSEDEDFGTKHISWESSNGDGQDSDDSDASWSSSSTFSPNDPPEFPSRCKRTNSVIEEVLAEDDLYKVLGVSKTANLDRLTLRRAYLMRSKACHPDKFPDNPEATQAFQKVSVAYDVLSKPSSKRMYDSSPRNPYDFAAHPYQHADETFRSVVLGVFNDFLDGDLETIRTMLRAINDLNPSMRLGEDAIDAVLLTLESIRQRALTCRTCILTLNAELAHIIEVQYAFRQLSLFDLKRRSRLTIELTRIAITLPVTLDRALQRQDQDLLRDDGEDTGPRNTALLNRRIYTMLCGFAVVLKRMESILS
ncbi:DnaJ-domain-containing protein [Cristinia sonorae]|uniref:DnaJ-domain-containing protein n=1 Tax=Cristinia sonorae TaxID=1940300 RepID=A0A8K0XPH9_9AGAR|nr:DnaJ-domain-containing protein [Cristinia sonorae]